MHDAAMILVVESEYINNRSILGGNVWNFKTRPFSTLLVLVVYLFHDLYTSHLIPLNDLVVSTTWLYPNKTRPLLKI